MLYSCIVTLCLFTPANSPDTSPQTPQRSPLIEKTNCCVNQDHKKNLIEMPCRYKHTVCTPCILEWADIRFKQYPGRFICLANVNGTSCGYNLKSHELKEIMDRIDGLSPTTQHSYKNKFLGIISKIQK